MNKRKDPVRFVFCGIERVKHEQFYRNIQMNKNSFLLIKTHFLDFCPDPNIFFRLLGAILLCFTKKMKFWCKIWYISIKMKFQNEKKSLPTYPILFW